MINCIVNRRLCQARKAQGSRLMVLETTPPILPEVQNYSPEEIVLCNRRLSSVYDGCGGGGVFSQQPGMFSLQGITVDGRLTTPTDDEQKWNATAPTQRSSRGEKMLSKHFVAPKARRSRRDSLHGCDFRPIHGFNAIDEDTVLHPKEVLYLQKIALASNEDTRRNNLSNGMARISVDGRIMEAVSAPSANTGGNLEEEDGEWDCFAPLQRVLIVAVAAAAAASSKHTNHKEINRLQKAVNDQENALSLMRRELSNLWDQVASEENGPLSFMIPKQIDIDPISSCVSPVAPVRDAPHREAPMLKTPEARSFQSESGSSDDSPGSCDSVNDDPVNKNVLLIQGPTDHLEADHLGDAKWYSNPLTEHSERSEDGAHSEHYFEDCTPEKRQRIFSRFTPDAMEPAEWLSVHSSFTPATAVATTPRTDRKRFSFEGLNALSMSSKLQSSNPGETASLPARCATILVEVKDQVLSVLDKEASQVMAALSHVIEKAQELEKVDRTKSSSRLGNSPEMKSQAAAALKQSVEKASSQVESLQAAVVSIWHTIGPHALASLRLSPPELESFLRRVTHLTPETLVTGDEKMLSTSEEGVQEWNQWLLVKHSEASVVPSLLSKIEAAANASEGDIQEFCSRSWKHERNEVAAAVGMAVRKTVDSLMATLDGREAAENFDSPMAKQRVSGLSGDAPQFLAQQLLGELEKAAAKIAGMEYQMFSLKQSMRDSEAQREKAELKLAEETARSHQNQINFEREMNELTTKLREKESAYDDLMRSRKVMFLVKSTEIAELKNDCQRRDMVLDDITAAAQATREASDQRLAVLEDICRRKDSAIQELRDEIIALEDQVHELQLQSPLLRYNGRRSTSVVRLSTDEALSLEDTFNGLRRQIEQTQGPSLPHESVALQSNTDDVPVDPQSSRSYMAADVMDFSATANVSPELPTQNCRFEPLENFMPTSCSMAEMPARFRASTSSLPTRGKEASASGKPLAVSIDRRVFPFPDATLFDDFLEVESSLQALKADEGALHSDEFCTPSNGDTLRSSHDFVSTSSKPGSGLHQLNSMTIGPESAGSNTRVSNSQRPRGQLSFTSADENKNPSGVMRPTKASSLKALRRSKATKKPSWNEEEGEITWVNAVVLASLEQNGSLNGSVISRRTSSTSNELKEPVWKPTATSKDNNKNSRRTRWL